MHAVDEVILEGESLSFEFSRTGDTTAALEVRYDITVEGGNNVFAEALPDPLTFTIPAGASSARIPGLLTNDNNDAGGVRVTATVLASSGSLSYDVGSPRTATVMVVDNRVTVHAVDEVIREGESLSFEFRRIGDTAAALEVRYDITVEGDSNVFAEALPAVLTFTIPVGASSARIPGLLTNDNNDVHEGGGVRVTAEVLASSGALPLPYDIGSSRTARVTVVDNDDPAAGAGAPATGLQVTGDYQVGETLTANTGDIMDADGTTMADYAYEWERAAGTDDAAVQIGTASTYTLAAADAGNFVRVTVRFTDDGFFPEVLSSPWREVAESATGPAPDPATGPATGMPIIQGTTRVGETLTANTDDIMDPDGLTGARAGDAGFAFTYQWQRANADGTGAADIVGETNSTYVLTADDANRRLLVRVNFRDDGNNAETLTGLGSSVVDMLPTGLPTIDGAAAVGQTLTAILTDIDDANGLSQAWAGDAGFAFTYQWRRANADGTGAADIAGETNSTYVPAAADADRRVLVRVSFADDSSYDHTLDSEATGIVSAPATGLALTGTPEVGQTLMADVSGITDPNGVTTASYTYRWWRATAADGTGGSQIRPEPGEPPLTDRYTLAAGDGGAWVRVSVTFTDDRGNDEILSSDWTAVSAPPESMPLTVSIVTADSALASTEGAEDNDLEFVVRLSAADERVITVPYTLSGTATEDADYADAGGGSLTFAASVTEQTITLTVTDDDFDEANSETVIVALGTPTGATQGVTLGATATETATITDDDDPDVVVRREGSATASEGGALAWSFTNLSAASQTYRIELGSGATAADIAYVELDPDSNPATDNQRLSPVNGGYEITVSHNTVARVAFGIAIDDDTAEGAEGLELVVFHGDGGTPADALFDAAGTETATITNVEQPTLLITSLAPSGEDGAPSVEEGPAADPIEFEVELSPQYAGPVTVTYTLSGTAVAGTDYNDVTDSTTDSNGAPVPGTLTFPGGDGTQATQTIRLALLDDATSEPEKTVIVTLDNMVRQEGQSSTAAAASALTAETAVTDDDDATSISVAAPAPQAPATEFVEGDDLVFTLTRTGGDLSLPLTVDYAVTATGAPACSPPPGPAMADFAPNEATTEAIVTACADNEDEPDGEVTLTLTESANYDIDETAGAATVPVADGNVLEVSIRAPTAVVAEGDAVEFAVILGDQTSRRDFDVFYTLEGDATPGVDYPLPAGYDTTSNRGNFTIPAYTESTAASPGFFFSIVATDDGVAEVFETVILSITGFSDDDIAAEVAGGAAATAVIGGADGILSLSLSDTEIAENGGTATLTVSTGSSTTFATDQTIILTLEGTAELGTDYTVTNDSDGSNIAVSGHHLFLPARDSSVSVTIIARDDAIDDDGETVLLSAAHLEADPDNGGAAIGTTLTLSIVEPQTLATGDFDLTIDGVSQVGAALTANTDAIDDADGLTTPNYRYQWERADDAAGTTGVINVGTNADSYTPVAADEGRFLRVTATFTDDLGNEETRTSDWTGAVAAAPATPNTPAVGDVTIDGVPRVGTALTANTNAIDDPADGLTAPNYRYQWERADDAAGATGVINVGTNADSYTPAAADEGRFLRVTATFTDDLGNQETRTSDWTGAVTAAPTTPNNPAAGLAVDGTAQVGQTLTANTNGVTDADGLGTPAYTYQWSRVDADGTSNAEDIAGATGRTYVLADADLGKRVRATVRFTDALGNNEILVSDLTSPVLALPGGNNPATGLRVMGDYKVGETLTAETGGITDADGLGTPAYTYQWQRATDAAGTGAQGVATTAAYNLAEADQGNYVQVVVRFTDADGNNEVLESRWTVVNAEDNEPAEGLEIDGTARVSETLTAITGGITDPNGVGAPTYAYQWSRVDADGTSNPEDIRGATGNTYVLTDDDANKRVRVTVEFADADGNAETLASDDSAVVDGPAAGLAVDGTAAVGQTLTADVSGITDPNGVTRARNGDAGFAFAYQWQRVDADGVSNAADIAGATAAAYALVAADNGRRIRVRVRFADDNDYDEELFAVTDDPVNTPAMGDVTIGPMPPQVHETLTADTSRITDANGPDPIPAASFSYQWQRATDNSGTGAANIAGAADVSYTAVEADQGNYVRVVVRFQDADGNDEMLSSDWSDQVIPEENVPASGGPTISGRAVIGARLTVSPDGITDANGVPASPAAFLWQWQRVDADGSSNLEAIPGATQSTYRLTAEDEGRRIRVHAIFVDNDGNPESVVSAATAVVEIDTTLDEAAVSKSLVLFGRAVTTQVLDAARLRLDGRCAAGSELTVAGQSVSWDSGAAEEGAWRALRWLSEFNGVSGQNVLAGSSFSMGRQTSENSCVSFWGRGSYSSYTDKEDGLEADGSAATGQLGVDWSSGRWMLGLSVAHSMGNNDYDHQAFDGERGEIDIDLTGLYPYTRYHFTERFSTWVAGGVGMGDLKFKPQGRESIKTDIDLLMGAGGFRGELLPQTEGGFSMAVKADAFYVQMESDEVEELLDATSTDTRRLRLGLEGAHTTELQGGSTVTPTLELGLLHDHGGGSDGSGMDVGLGVTYENAGGGFLVDLKGRSLVAHEAGSLKEWGVSGELRYDLDLSSERGFALSLNSGYGARAGGGAEALYNLRNADSLGLAREMPGARLGAEIGYGLGAFGDRFISKPWAGMGMTETGSEWRLGWQLAPAAAHNPLRLRLGVELNHRAGDQALMLNLGAGL